MHLPLTGDWTCRSPTIAPTLACYNVRYGDRDGGRPWNIVYNYTLHHDTRQVLSGAGTVIPVPFILVFPYE